MTDDRWLIENLATLVVRLSRCVEKHQPGITLVSQANDFLKRHGLPTGSILREEPLRACPHAEPHVYFPEKQE